MIIDGRTLSQKIYSEIIAEKITDTRLCIILANDDLSSKKYTELKKKAGENIGIKVDIFDFNQFVSKDELIKKIKDLNNDSTCHGIVVQLPLFEHLESATTEILNVIDPKKDADGLTSSSLATAFDFSEKSVMPAAVEAVMIAIESIMNFKEIEGMHILVINNSNLVGNPLAIALSKLNATVTIAHKYTKNLMSLVSSADITISATGATNIISSDNIKEGAILIDITSVSKDGKVFGDFIYNNDLINKAKAYTPVPGGIGPLTVASLFKNLIKLRKFNG